jgi:hypothetical protein
MKNGWRLLLVIVVSFGGRIAEGAVVPQGSSDRIEILDTRCPFRTLFALSPTVARIGGAITVVETNVLSHPTPVPKNWAAADFDDSGWTRQTGPLCGRPSGATERSGSTRMSMILVRGRFMVDEPMRQRLGAEFAAGCQALLDERTRWFVDIAREGERGEWYSASQWRDLNERLFAAAAEADAKCGIHALPDAGRR